MKKLLIAAAAIAIATPALAHTDGDLSTSSSQGSLDVNVVIPKMVRVSGLDDLSFSITPAMLTEPYHSREDQTSTFCVYSNDGANGAYKLQVSAAHSGVVGIPWGLTGPDSTILPYEIWTSDNTGNQFKTWNFGQSTTYASNADGNGRRTTLDCSDHGENASLKVGIRDAQLLAAEAGTYTGTVTVTVSTI